MDYAGRIVVPLDERSAGQAIDDLLAQGVEAIAVCLARMFAASPRHRDRLMASWMGDVGVHNLFGTDQRGEPFGTALMDTMAGGAGARDGVDTGGFLRSLTASIANVETYEFRFPLLYLYRRQEPDSGGPGRMRGGVGISSAVVPYGVAAIPANIMTCCAAEHSESAGIDGGGPGSSNGYVVHRGARVAQQWAAGLLPAAPEEIVGTREPQPAGAISRLAADDVCVLTTPGGGGFGDPLERDAAAVAFDVRGGLVSAEWAARGYGVALAGEEVDTARTAQLSEAIRERRRAEAETPLAPPAAENDAPARTAPGQVPLTSVLSVDAEGAPRWFRCRCGQPLAPASVNYKTCVPFRAVPQQVAGPLLNPHNLGRGRFVLREYYCPRCWILLAVDTSVPEDPHLWDVEPTCTGRYPRL